MSRQVATAEGSTVSFELGIGASEPPTRALHKPIAKTSFYKTFPLPAQKEQTYTSQDYNEDRFFISYSGETNHKAYHEVYPNQNKGS